MFSSPVREDVVRDMKAVSAASPDWEQWLLLALEAGDVGFHQKVLNLVLRASGASGAGIYLLAKGGERLALKVQHGLPAAEGAWREWISRQLQLVIKKRSGFGPVNTAEGDFHFVPLVWRGAGFGVLVLCNARSVLGFSTLAGWAIALPQKNRFPDHAKEFLRGIDFTRWPGIFAGQLQRQARASRASLLQERAGQWRVIAVSGIAEVRRRTPELRHIEQQFGKALAGGGKGSESGMAVLFKNAPQWGLFMEGVEAGALLQESFQELMLVGEGFLPHLPLSGWRGYLSRLIFRPRSPKGSRRVVAAVGAALLMVGLLPVRESFDGRCEIQPASRYSVVTEIEGRVSEVAVEDGAYVKVGQTLAVLDSSGLQTKLAVTRQLREQQEAEARREQGLQEMTAFRLAQLKARQSANEEAKLLKDIEHATIVSPIDGRVLTRDLAQRQGTVMKMGETFCEIGSFDAWDLEIALPEEDLHALESALEPGGKLPVHYRLKAGVTFALEAQLGSARQISQMAYPLENQNVVYITLPKVALPTELREQLRPGFSGEARIEGKRKCLAEIVSRRLRQYLWLHWMPGG